MFFLRSLVGVLMLFHAVPAAPATPAEESCFTAAINSERGAVGLSTLTTNGDLVSIAEGWSQVLATAGSLSHNPNLPNQAPSVWMSLGENVGEGPTCDSIATAFYNSPEHRANILDINYNQVGVGVVDAPDGTIWVTEDFMGTANPVSTSTKVTPPPSPAPVSPAAAPTHAVVVAPATHAPVPAPTHAVIAAPAPSKPAPPAPVHTTAAPSPSPSPSPVVTASPSPTAVSTSPSATPPSPPGAQFPATQPQSAQATGTLSGLAGLVIAMVLCLAVGWAWKLQERKRR
jgi:hypothetical protein